MKKMKRVAGNSYHQPLFHMVDDETGARFKQQRLLQEYLQVQKASLCFKKKKNNFILVFFDVLCPYVV